MTSYDRAGSEAALLPGLGLVLTGARDLVRHLRRREAHS